MALRTMGPSGSTNLKTRVAETANMARGYPVKQGVNDGGVGSITVLGARAVGVQQEATVNIGDAVLVVESGETIAIAGAAVVAGNYVKADATGRLIPVTGTAGGGEEVIGRAVSSQATVGGEFVVEVKIFIL